MISIITPVYNGKRFIEFCIKNVIEQNCPEAEHIIMDGGSTDGTVEIIRHYAGQYSHIHWISEKDKGQSDAMNKGIAMAGGEIVGFLNADDFYEPGVLNRIAELFKTLPDPTLLVGNCNVWDDDGKIAEVNRPAKLKITDLVLKRRINMCPLNPSAYFYHKSLHDKIGLYDINEHFTLDIDFICRAVQSAHVGYVDEIWGNYRKIAGTKTVRDKQNGTCSARYSGVMEKYRKQLTLSQRIEVGVRDGYGGVRDGVRTFLFVIICYISKKVRQLLTDRSLV
jgi:glycosyltransferase involved in cell wall biosynthesis